MTVTLSQPSPPAQELLERLGALLAASLALRSCKLILHDGVIDIDFRLLIYLVTRLNNNTNV